VRPGLVRYPEPPIPELAALGLRTAGGRGSRGTTAMSARPWLPASEPSASPPSLSATNALLPVATAFPFLTP
jgi:hypothetical protein